jgi:hypothetical protein
MEGRCDDHQVSYSCKSSCTIAFFCTCKFSLCRVRRCVHTGACDLLNWVSGWQFQSWEAVEGEGTG